jgi:2-furoyl-CoA dehydrogenase large subunit
MPPMKNGSIESASPFTPLGAKGMGEGGGAGIHAVCAALQNALGRRGEGPIVWRSCNPYESVWELLQKPEQTRKLVSVESR